MAKRGIRLEIVSYRSNFITIFIEELFSCLKIKRKDVKIITLPKKRKLITVLKSPFVNKKAMEQFSLKRSKRLLIIKPEYSLELKKVLEKITIKNVAVKIKGV